MKFTLDAFLWLRKSPCTIEIWLATADTLTLHRLADRRLGLVYVNLFKITLLSKQKREREREWGGGDCLLPINTVAYQKYLNIHSNICTISSYCGALFRSNIKKGILSFTHEEIKLFRSLLTFTFLFSPTWHFRLLLLKLWATRKEECPRMVFPVELLPLPTLPTIRRVSRAPPSFSVPHAAISTPYIYTQTQINV